MLQKDNQLLQEFMKNSNRFYCKNNGNITNKMHIKFISLFYVNSLLHVSALLGHPQGDSQAVHYITAVDGCPIVAGFLVVHSASNVET
jgi:hypothetical protein